MKKTSTKKPARRYKGTDVGHAVVRHGGRSGREGTRVFDFILAHVFSEVSQEVFPHAWINSQRIHEFVGGPLQNCC